MAGADGCDGAQFLTRTPPQDEMGCASSDCKVSKLIVKLINGAHDDVTSKSVQALRQGSPDLHGGQANFGGDDEGDGWLLHTGHVMFVPPTGPPSPVF